MAGYNLKPLLYNLLLPAWRIVDFCTPKKADHWAFATHHLHSERFIENQRAVFEQVKADPSLHKIIFFRGQPAEWHLEDAVNYRMVRHGSLAGILLLARCKVVFLTHSIAMDYSLRWGRKGFTVLKLNTKRRVVVNLWHGIALKRLLSAANSATLQHTDRVAYRTQERKHYAGLIASSDIDSYAMAAMFYPLNYKQVWLTGLPRNDFLTQSEALLPRYITKSLETIRSIKRGKKLIVYAPTYRQTSINDTAYYYQFSQVEVDALKHFLQANNAILGYRPHYFKNSNNFFNLDEFIDNELIFDLSQAVIHEYSALARELDLLITDYSSVYIEALYLNKPVICFGYDIEHYRTQQDGLLYDMDLAFPGPIVQKFYFLISVLQERLQATSETIELEQATAKKLFFKYNDANNSQRVVERVYAALK